MTSFTISTILEKSQNRDKDFRYMATSDLLTELQKDNFKPDTEGEKKICRAVLKLLNDTSSDVQGLAVKCLTPLVRKVHDAQVDEIMVELCKQVLTGKEEQRDVASIGLKTVVLEMPTSMGMVAVRQLTPQLVAGLKQDVLEVKIECMDILNDVLKRFGANLKEEEAHACLEALFSQLSSTRVATRKRAISCIASLSAALPDKLLTQLVGSIADKGRAEKGLDLRRTYIQTLSAISRSGGYRLGKQLETVVPLVLQQCTPKKEGDAEMIESCLQAFESFLLRCRKEVVTYEAEIAKTTLHYLSYDPNYADDDEEMDDADDEDEDMSDDGDDAEYSDDDDVSWKVRRAATRTLSALILVRPDQLPSLVPSLAPELISRFKEREENVKMDIFATFGDLLVAVGAGSRQADAPSDPMAVDSGDGGACLSPAAAAMLNEVPRLIKAIAKQLKEKAVKTRVAAFHCLRQLASSVPGCLVGHAAVLIPGVVRALKDSTGANSLRIEALGFLRLALSSHPPAVFQPHVSELLPIVLGLAQDRYYKLSAEALRVCSGICKVLRPSPPAADFDYAKHVGPIFSNVKQRLLAQDQDQEVKECAIACMAAVIFHLGDACPSELPTTLPILLERLRNEITRVTAVKAFAMLASASLDAVVQAVAASVLQPVVAELASFLRKSNRPLRQASLSALDTIVGAYGAANLKAADFDLVLEEIPEAVSEADLHIAHLALVLATTMVSKAAATIVPKLSAKLMPKALAMLQSSLLQGQPLRSLLAFFAELVAHDAKQLNFSVLTEKLLAIAAANPAMSKHSLASLSQAVAVCCTHAPQKAQRASMVDRFVKQLGGPDGQERVLALLCLGEIGNRNDLSSHRGLVDAVMASFSSSSEEVKAAASFALGNISAGNLPHYLPGTLEAIKTSAHEYPMLYALKDLISSVSTSGGAQLSAYAEQMLPCLFGFASRDEEGVRNVAAECLGKLAAIAPSVIPALEERLSNPSPFTRSVVVNSMRFIITEGGGGGSAMSPASIRKFLSTLEDSDLKVRRGALLALNCVAHNRPTAIREGLSELLPMLYGETVKKPELVHQVDLGPFKHTVDDGLELRKAAFECMDTLLESLSEKIELSAFLQHLLSGLSDDHDIKLLCHSMLSKLAASTSNQAVIVSTLDAVVDPLRATVNATLKDNAVKQQIERHDELVRSAMRAIRALEKMGEADTCHKFTEFVRALRAGKLAEKYKAVCELETAQPTGED